MKGKKIFDTIRKPIPPPNKVETPKSSYDRRINKKEIEREMEETL